jgi:hypothetical protein
MFMKTFLVLKRLLISVVIVSIMLRVEIARLTSLSLHFLTPINQSYISFNFYKNFIMDDAILDQSYSRISGSRANFQNPQHNSNILFLFPTWSNNNTQSPITKSKSENLLKFKISYSKFSLFHCNVYYQNHQHKLHSIT